VHFLDCGRGGRGPVQSFQFLEGEADGLECVRDLPCEVDVLGVGARHWSCACWDVAAGRVGCLVDGACPDAVTGVALLAPCKMGSFNSEGGRNGRKEGFLFVASVLASVGKRSCQAVVHKKWRRRPHLEWLEGVEGFLGIRASALSFALPGRLVRGLFPFLCGGFVRGGPDGQGGFVLV
jgi:hypothetical protein